MTLLSSFILAMSINIAMFFPAYFLKTDKLTDISYCLTFLVISLLSFLNSPMTWEGGILFGMIGIWAFRLGIYLLLRIRKTGRDNRFNEMREHFGKFLGFWVLQGFTVWVVLLPSIFYLGNMSAKISWISALGLAIFGIGLGIEIIADQQKNHFYTHKANKGKWLDSGLWHYSRHPNYFGEILVWIGIYIYTIRSLDLWQSVIGIISPLYIATLLIFVSGIPILEKSADAKFGANRDYLRYKKNTNRLVLWFSKNK